MISHKYKCIFLHIPKCAGTSVEKVLGHFDGFAGRGGQDHRSLRLLQPSVPVSDYFLKKSNLLEGVRRLRYSYSTHANTNNKLQVTRREFDEYYKFTIVRNPWDRAYSWYKNATRDSIHRKHLGIDSEITFEDFLTQFIGKGFLKPQIYWLENYKGEVDLDFVGKFENLKEDFREVSAKLGLTENDLPHAVKGDAQKSYKGEFSNKAHNLVRDFYAREIELFGYEF